MSLKFIALSGTTSVTENLYVYEYGGDMMIVDCGVGFPDIEMHGVDLVIPDFSYIKQNEKKLKGIIVSQGHEDHQGALPFLLDEVRAPIYAPKLTAAFIEDKLDDYQVKGVKINTYNPDKDTFSIGQFKITPFRVTHSIPDTVGFAIDTPEGRVFHVAEHKFDPNPTVGSPFDIQRARQLASKGVLCLVSDCLGANRKGSTPPEAGIEGNIKEIVDKSKGAVYFSCISSNISRIQQAINVAAKTGRKVVFAGYSVEKKSMISKELGYLKFSKKLVITQRQARKYYDKKLMYIIAGSFGQIGSNLFRLATGGHRELSAGKGDTAILASNPGPPYSKENIDFVVDSLIDLGVDVHYYDLDEGLHVSGHGAQDDIMKLFDIVNPRYYIPIGGTIRFMHSYKKLVEDHKPKGSVFLLKPGESVTFKNKTANFGKKIPVKEVMVDGLGIGDVGRVILEDRKTLKEHGVAIAIIKIEAGKRKLPENPEIISRGFVFEKKEKEFLRESGKALRKRLEKRKKFDRRSARYIAADYLQDYFFQKTRRRPLVIPVVVEV